MLWNRSTPIPAIVAATVVIAGCASSATMSTSDPRYLPASECGGSMIQVVGGDSALEYRIEKNRRQGALSVEDQAVVNKRGEQHPLMAHVVTVAKNVGEAGLQEGVKTTTPQVVALLESARAKNNGDQILAVQEVLPELVSRAQRACQRAGYSFNIHSVSVQRPLEAQARASIRAATPQEKIALSAAIESRLNDPKSAMYRNTYVVPDSYACVEVNSKNRMGGYVGFQYAVLTHVQGQWFFLDTIPQPTQQCLDIIVKWAAEGKSNKR